jgi:hypothetical protein
MLAPEIDDFQKQLPADKRPKDAIYGPTHAERTCCPNLAHPTIFGVEDGLQRRFRTSTTM